MTRRFVGMALLVGFGAHGDSLFSRQVADRGTLISEDKARFKPGDMVTVLVRENIDARADSLLDTEKKSKIDAQSPESENASLTDGWFNLQLSDCIERHRQPDGVRSNHIGKRNCQHDHPLRRYQCRFGCYRRFAGKHDV